MARRRRVRGAGLVEYALGVSLVLSASVGAMSEFEKTSGDALEERGDGIGAPDIGSGGTTTTTIDAPVIEDGATTTTTAPPTPPTTTVASATGTASANGKRWTATVVILITDGTDPVHKARIDARWIEHPTNDVTTVSCETQPNGTCTFSLRDLGTFGESHHVATADFVVTGVTPLGGTTTNPGLTTVVTEP